VISPGGPLGIPPDRERLVCQRSLETSYPRALENRPPMGALARPVSSASGPNLKRSGGSRPRTAR
jgi:hypothetical protein